MLIERELVEKAYEAQKSDDAVALKNLLEGRSPAFIDELLKRKYTPRGKPLSSLIRNHPQCNAIIKQLKTFKINDLPVEVMENTIYPKLSNQALANLMRTCKTQKTNIEGSNTFDSRMQLASVLKSGLTYWQNNASELNLSHDLRAELLGISIPPNASDMSNLLFIDKAKNILDRILSQLQQVKSEIAYLKQNATALDINENLRTRLINHPILQDTPDTLNLALLIETNSLVNEINLAIISRKIDLRSTRLAIQYSNLTRLPRVLLNEPALQNYWNRLTDLDCIGNQLTNLDVTGLSALQALWCVSNQLTNLDVTGLSALRILRCSNNQLTNLDLTGLSALLILRCSNNQLTNLDATGLSALPGLWCVRNELTITKKLRAQFGDAWANQTQATQRVMPILPGFEAIVYSALDVSSVKTIVPKFKSITDAIGNHSSMTTDVTDEDMANLYWKRPYAKRGIT